MFYIALAVAIVGASKSLTAMGKIANRLKQSGA